MMKKEYTCSVFLLFSFSFYCTMKAYISNCQERNDARDEQEICACTYERQDTKPQAIEICQKSNG